MIDTQVFLKEVEAHKQRGINLSHYMGLAATTPRIFDTLPPRDVGAILSKSLFFGYGDSAEITNPEKYKAIYLASNKFNEAVCEYISFIKSNSVTIQDPGNSKYAESVGFVRMFNLLTSGNPTPSEIISTDIKYLARLNDGISYKRGDIRKCFFEYKAFLEASKYVIALSPAYYAIASDLRVNIVSLFMDAGINVELDMYNGVFTKDRLESVISIHYISNQQGVSVSDKIPHERLIEYLNAIPLDTLNRIYKEIDSSMLEYCEEITNAKY